VTVSAYLAIVGALGFVLILLGGTFAVLRKFVGQSAGAQTRVRLEVVQRIALGPKQGIAVVRIGQSAVAVSLGEGGIRPLLQVEGEDLQAILAAAPAAQLQMPPVLARPAAWVARVTGKSPTETASTDKRPFSAALQGALKAYLPVLVVALFAATLLGPSLLDAQTVVPPIAREEAAGPDGAGFAQVDTMLARLAPELDLRIGQPDEGGLRLSGTVGIVVMMGLLTLLPTLLLMMTSFTRILVVLHFLRQALGTQSAPPAHLMAALALLISGFVMAPTLSEVNSTALQPWMNGEIDQSQMLTTGVAPFREFMLTQTRETDLATFIDLRGDVAVDNATEIPLVVLMSAFVTSELRTAFQIGFSLFLPFIVVDVVVAAVLMSMGMFMLPPAMISLPFKLLLFVLVDGWSLIVQGLVQSFG